MNHASRGYCTRVAPRAAAAVRPPLLFEQRLDDRPLVGQVHARLVLRVDVSPRPYNAAAAVPGKAETRRHYRTHRARSGQGGVGWLCPNPKARVCPNPPATISSLALHPRSASNLTAFRTPKSIARPAAPCAPGSGSCPRRTAPQPALGRHAPPHAEAFLRSREAAYQARTGSYPHGGDGPRVGEA